MVTGASGTLGFNIANQLASDSRNIVLLPLRNIQPDRFPALPNLTATQIDLSDRRQTRRMIEEFRPTAIVHCAASGVRPARPLWFDMLSFNVAATLRLFETSCALPQCHFIYISTGLVYLPQGRPLAETDPIGNLHPYGASKAAADHLLQAGAAEFGRRLTILRPFSFTGLHDGGNRLFPSLLSAAASKTPFRMSAGDQIRDFCAVQDIAGAVETIINRESVSPVEIFNLGSGLSLKVRQIVEDVRDQLNLDVDLQFGANTYHPYESMHLVADIAKARSIPWQPRVNLAFAVWQLARVIFPALPVRQPREEF